MEAAILKLSLKVPPEFTESQWAYCIHWTWQLHSNYGHESYTPTVALERMSAELLVRIDAGADRKTIDWFWDEYLQACPKAEQYQRFRPTIPGNRGDLEAGMGDNTLGGFQSGYRERTGEKPVAVTGNRRQSSISEEMSTESAR